MQRVLDWDNDDAGEQVTSHEDDEYRWAGVEDPKIVITTSRDPSSRLKIFAKVIFEIQLIRLFIIYFYLILGIEIVISKFTKTQSW